MSDPVRDFVAGVLEQARGALQADRRLSETGMPGAGRALKVTENVDGDTVRTFVVGFDTVGDPTAIVR